MSTSAYDVSFESWAGDLTFYAQYILREDLFLQAKQRAAHFLASHGLRVPRTYHVIDALGATDVPASLPSEFVIKPDVGQQGDDISFVTRVGEGFVDQNGEQYNQTDIVLRLAPVRERDPWQTPVRVREHLYLCCERIRSHPAVAALGPDSSTLVDFRLYFVDQVYRGGFLRVPGAPEGLGNVCRGARVLNVDVDGSIREQTDLCPPRLCLDHYGQNVEGWATPSWERVLATGHAVAHLLQSRLVCVDGTVGEDGDFVILEVTLKPSQQLALTAPIHAALAAAAPSRASAITPKVYDSLTVEAYRAWLRTEAVE